MTTVIEGEVVDITSTTRRIERNAARTPEVLPPDVDTKVVAISRLDTPEMQTRAVTTMLNHARTGLLAAIAAQDLPEIVKFKQKATAIHDIAKQVRLGKDIQMDAAEFVRRAERGLGVAIREGQEHGEVRRKGQVENRANQHGRVGESVDTFISSKPTDFATGTELSGVGREGGIYAMTDGVSDEQFEEAIAEAKSEGNLSRANVARKAKAKAQDKEPIDADDPLIDAEVEPEPEAQPKKRLTKHDSTEMLANINGMLNGIVESLPFMNPGEIDATENRLVIENIRNSMGSIRKLLKEINNG